MAKINIKIEGVPYQVEQGLTILEAAKAAGEAGIILTAENIGNYDFSGLELVTSETEEE